MLAGNIPKLAMQSTHGQVFLAVLPHGYFIRRCLAKTQNPVAQLQTSLMGHLPPKLFEPLSVLTGG